MMYAIGETPRDRVEHLLKLRDLQDETGGFTAFICWPFQPGNTKLAGDDQAASAPMYLRQVALARLALDNIPNLQASWPTMGPAVSASIVAMLAMSCQSERPRPIMSVGSISQPEIVGQFRSRIMGGLLKDLSDVKVIALCNLRVKGAWG